MPFAAARTPVRHAAVVPPVRMALTLPSDSGGRKRSALQWEHQQQWQSPVL